MKVYGAKKIGIITPYQAIGDQQVIELFTQIGCEVISLHGMKCASATSISEVSSDEIKAAFREVNSCDVELLIQAGTNLLAAKAAAEMEEKLGKPVIAISTATVWHAYRTNGIKDQIKDWGWGSRSIDQVTSRHSVNKSSVDAFPDVYDLQAQDRL